jgi:hypothetical protein
VNKKLVLDSITNYHIIEGKENNLMQIKERFDNSIIFENDADTMRQTVLDAKSADIVLSGADLSRACLSGANLHRADLSGANLHRADLSRACLSGADLSGAYLRGADLSGADLSRADLSGANLHRADLSGAYLSRANLHRADLSEAIGVFSFGPIGETCRIGYAVDSADGVMFALGCFWGNEKEAIAAICEKYGPKSNYEAQVKLAAKIIKAAK